MTWRDLIQRTLEDLGVYGQAQPASANDMESCRQRMNDWIDDLKTQGLSIYQTARTVWTLTGASSYTVGTGQTVNVARPPSSQFISALSFVNTNTVPPYEFPLGPPITDQEYQGIPFKTLNATYPSGFFYDNTYPIAALKPFPVPTGSNLQGVMYSGVPIDEVDAGSIGATIALPPGYRRMMRLGLQIECAPAFRVPIPQATKDLFDEAKGNVKRVNEVLEVISFGDAGKLFGGRGSQSNIYTGES